MIFLGLKKEKGESQILLETETESYQDNGLTFHEVFVNNEKEVTDFLLKAKGSRHKNCQMFLAFEEKKVFEIETAENFDALESAYTDLLRKLEESIAAIG